MKFQFGTKAILLVTAIVAIALGGMLSWEQIIGLPTADRGLFWTVEIIPFARPNLASDRVRCVCNRTEGNHGPNGCRTRNCSGGWRWGRVSDSEICLAEWIACTCQTASYNQPSPVALTAVRY
jgi:hypothetical protein